MRTLLVIAVSLLCCIPSSGRKMQKAKASNAGTAYIESSFGVYDAMQKKIHSLAELGYLEYESSQLLARHLEEHGFKVDIGVAGIPTAFVATYGSGSPVIGLLAEYDALPGMSQDTVSYKSALVAGAPGHGCGHNAETDNEKHNDLGVAFFGFVQFQRRDQQRSQHYKIMEKCAFNIAIL